MDQLNIGPNRRGPKRSGPNLAQPFIWLPVSEAKQQCHLLFHTMGRGDRPVFVEERCPTFMQEGRSPPLP